MLGFIRSPFANRHYDRRLKAARFKQIEAARFWQNGHFLLARYKFWRAGHKSKICWIESGDFMTHVAQTAYGTHAKYRATTLAKRYYKRALPELPSEALCRKIAAQYTALRALDCRPQAKQAHQKQATGYLRLAQRLRYRDIAQPLPPGKPEALYGDTSVPVPDEGPVPLLAALRARSKPAAASMQGNGKAAPVRVRSRLAGRRCGSSAGTPAPHVPRRK